MKKIQQPKRHHFVPSFLLRHWERDGQLTVYSWVGGKVTARPRPAGSVGFEEHLYSTLDDAGERDATIETELMERQVDTPGSLVHSRLIERDVLTPDDRVTWARFLVAQFLRTPRAVSVLRQRGVAIAERFRMEGRFSEASVAQQDLIVNNLGILTLPQLVWSSKLNEALLLAEWVVLDLSSAGRLLLIGDLPILREGQLDGAFILVIPLSPTRLFLAFSSED